MKKLSYKVVAILILLFALILLIIFMNNTFNEYFKSIIIAISINLISSVIIIYLIDFKREEDKNQEIENKRKLIYKQLIHPLISFDELISNMYKSTSSLQEMNDLEYSIDNIDMIIEKILLLDVNKKSYVINKDLKTTQLWRQTIALKLLVLLENVEKFYGNNSYILSIELSKELDQILNIGLNKIVLNFMLDSTFSIDMEGINKVFNFKKLLIASFNIKNEISIYYPENQFKINWDNYLREDTSPIFGSGIKEELN